MAEIAPNFVILIGGPGKFVPCDRKHDLTWKNYIVPIQLETQKLVGKGETIHWWVYGPAYKERWEDDVAYVSAPKPVKPGENLFDSRKAAVDAIRKLNATDYLGRIRQMADSLGVQFKILDKPDDFWQGLEGFSDGSVSRVWYIGHAYQSGLMLKLTHSPAPQCTARADAQDIIYKSVLESKRATIGKKLGIDPNKSSKFYGCNSAEFAKQWNDIFAVCTEGALSKIDFGVIDQASSERNVMKRLELSSQSGWATNSCSPVAPGPAGAGAHPLTTPSPQPSAPGS